jgi:hypothetical protein
VTGSLASPVGQVVTNRIDFSDVNAVVSTLRLMPEAARPAQASHLPITDNDDDDHSETSIKTQPPERMQDVGQDEYLIIEEDLLTDCLAEAEVCFNYRDEDYPVGSVLECNVDAAIVFDKSFLFAQDR